MGNKSGAGPFTPAVVVVRKAMGKKEFNQFRGKAISLHSQGVAPPTQAARPCLPTHALPRPCARVLHSAAPCYRACVDLTLCASVAAQSSKSLARTWA